MKTFRAELHTHTVLSPCASIEMIPPLIIAEAQSKHIDILAITDHNSIENIQAVMKAAEGSGLIIIPGIELQTQEEIHSICIFDTLSRANAFFKSIESTLPHIENNSEFFGEQFIVDETGDFIRREKRLLIASAALSLSDAYTQVVNHQGLMIPAHVNRSAYGLLPTLGFVPQDIDLQILEISKHLDPDKAKDEFPQLAGYHLIQNGDAHYLNDITGFNQFTMEMPTIREISLAIQNIEGRSYKNLFHSLTNRQ